MQVSVFWVKVIQGLIILAAMFIDAQRVRLKEISISWLEKMVGKNVKLVVN